MEPSPSVSKGTTTHEAVRGRLPPSSDGSTLVSLGIADKETVDKIILLWDPRCSLGEGAEGGRWDDHSVGTTSVREKTGVTT